MNIKPDRIEARISSPHATLREMDIEVAWEAVSSEWEQLLDHYVRRARLDGFRRGKAPRHMVKRLFFKEIREDLLESLLPKAVNEVLRRENIKALTTPMVSDILFHEGESLRFRARVEVLPEFRLPEYKKIRAKKKEVKVEDREVNESLEQLRQKSAEYLPVEGRGVAEGDYVLLEWKAKDAATQRRMPTERMLVLAGHPENEKGLNENVLGMRPQETRRFSISYPPDHPNKKFAGRTLENEITLISIKEKKVPEMSDEWAKDLGDFENLDSLREKIQKELERSKREVARQEMADEIVETIAGGLALELPKSLVEQEAMSIVKNWVSGAKDPVTEEQLENLSKQARIQAEKRIKKSLILQKIAAEERLEVTEEEVDEEIRDLAQRNNVPLAQFADRVNRDGKREDLKAALLIRKAIDFLLENAVLYEVPA